jgi:hypothetical protein
LITHFIEYLSKIKLFQINKSKKKKIGGGDRREVDRGEKMIQKRFSLNEGHP